MIIFATDSTHPSGLAGPVGAYFALEGVLGTRAGVFSDAPSSKKVCHGLA